MRAPLGAAAFAHPEPDRRKARIWPVFLPFLGCPGRCVYCSQPATTGTSPASLEEIHDTLALELDRALDAGTAPLELGFFGGTFTALPAPWPERFLNTASRFRDKGLLTRIRCSTRPDAAAPDLLARLAGHGLDMVELGVQTFHGPTLAASGRNYSPETAHGACEAVRDAGLDLGIQLLPGLPGHTPAHLLADTAATAAHRPAAVRIYPCVVLAGTPLAKAFAAGTYRPWELETTIPALAEALGTLWASAIPVIRMGLAPEQDLRHNILAGPWHPALGQLARSLALFRHIKTRAAALPAPPKRLTAPRRYQSDTLGHQGSLRGRYDEIGIRDIAFDDDDSFRLE